MSRTRYEPIPQHPESIDLEALQNHSYNSGLPSSAPSSIAPAYHNHNSTPSVNFAPSIHSIPNSPPPSFHTHSSPGTPRPAPSTHATGEYAELWGIAASTNGAQTDVCAGSEALQTIAQLKTRVEQLEETIGKLLLQQDEGAPGSIRGGNCCMTYTDASPALQRAVTAAGGNCCVTFHRSPTGNGQGRQRGFPWLLLAMMICGTMIVMSYALRPSRHEGGVTQEGTRLQ